MEHKYFQFPLMLIRQVHRDPNEAKQNILRFALVDFALKQTITEEDAARQLLYNYLRGGGLTKAIQLFEDGKSDKWDATIVELRDRESLDYGFFTEANQAEIISEVINVLNKNPELSAAAIMNCQLNKINDFFGVSGPGPDMRLRDYNVMKREIDAQEAKHGKEPRPTILKELFFDLIEQPELFAFYIAIRSLEGPRKFTATNRPTIAGRAAGYKSAALLPKDNKVFKKFSSRHYSGKFERELMSRSLIKGILRKKQWSKFYISTKLTPRELGRAVAEYKMRRDVQKKNAEAMESYLQVYNATSI